MARRILPSISTVIISLLLLLWLFPAGLHAQRWVQPNARWAGDTLLPVRQHKHWGFINLQGKVVIPLVYDAVEPFTPGATTTKALKDGRLFIINNLNLIVSQVDYEDIHVATDSLLMAKKNGRWGIYSRRGE